MRLLLALSLIPCLGWAIPFDPSWDGPHEQEKCTIEQCRYALCYHGIDGAWGYYATQDKRDPTLVLITYVRGHTFSQGFIAPLDNPYKICTNKENLLQFYGKDAK